MKNKLLLSHLKSAKDGANLKDYDFCIEFIEAAEEMIKDEMKSLAINVKLCRMRKSETTSS